MSSALTVHIVSDVVCPWCVVGYRQLQTAADRLDLPLSVRWHPFELNPDMPPDGEDLADHLRRKYGTTPEQSLENRNRLTALGADVGFSFRFGEGLRMRNTFRAHQLLHWAGETAPDTQTALKMALFQAHFTDNAAIDDPEVLIAAAATAGLNVSDARTVLDSGSMAGAVRHSQQHWQSQGISGVPAMIFLDQYLVSGARGVDGYTQILQQIMALPSSPPPAS